MTRVIWVEYYDFPYTLRYVDIAEKGGSAGN